MNVSFSDLFKFDRFFTPILIRVIYLIWIIGGGLYTIFSIISLISVYGELAGEFAEYTEVLNPMVMNFGLIGGIVGSIIFYLLGILFIRLLLEAMIVVFNIYGNLHSMKETLSGTESTSFQRTT